MEARGSCDDAIARGHESSQQLGKETGMENGQLCCYAEKQNGGSYGLQQGRDGNEMKASNTYSVLPF